MDHSLDYPRPANVNCPRSFSLIMTLKSSCLSSASFMSLSLTSLGILTLKTVDSPQCFFANGLAFALLNVFNHV